MKAVLTAGAAAAAILTAAPALAQTPMPGMDHPMPAAASPEAGSQMEFDPGLIIMPMRGALGAYSMNREASGTAWQPDASEHGGVMTNTASGWMLMGHALFNGVYDQQSGPRGDQKGFVSGMVMGMAQRRFGDSTIQFRGMVSPDPLMGRRGYPLLLASGETADGITPLIDRQHPHDLFMELSASFSRDFGGGVSAFVYGGLPGEPAFGPPAFMHRASIMDSPEAPIAHHWLDSTHITFGVVTGGLIVRNWKAEVSRFRGREPDENRYDIETGELDSMSARLSWNPLRSLSLQASWARVISPEALEPDEDLTKWSASAIYTRGLADGGWWSTTAAWGRKVGEDATTDAYALESAIHPSDKWTVFGRLERTENPELGGALHGPAYPVAKASAGAIRDWRVATNVRLGLGGLYQLNHVPKALESAYGRSPDGVMAFIRIKVD